MRSLFAEPSVVLALVLLAFGCGNHDDAAPSSPSVCGAAPVAHPPGELVAGEDPATLMAPYWGDYPGTLTWVKGGVTPFTLSLEPGTDPNVYAANCDPPPTIYAYADVGLTTADGALAETDTSIFELPVPGTTVDSSLEVLGPSVISDWQWQGDVLPHLPSDNASYTDRGLVPEIDWPLGTPEPSALRLYFYGRFMGAMVSDRVLVASVTFP